MKNKITVIGIGPGHEGDMTARAMEALRCADIIVGYNYYVPFISHLLKPDAEIVKTGMKQERARIDKAMEIRRNLSGLFPLKKPQRCSSGNPIA